MATAGFSVSLFYLTTSRNVRALGPGDDAPLLAKVIVGVSLTAWVAVMICGRLITSFRP